MERIQSLVMRDVTRRFGAATALENFSLAIAGGAFVTLLGPSGCGKTTALNCLAGLLDLSAGEILLNGHPIHQLPAERRGFGMVFQNYALFPHLTVNRNVGYGLEIRGGARREREERIQRALERVHLEAYQTRYPAQLSGGQQQRLAIARTLVLEPSLLLLDEPLSNLDTNLRTEMRIEIKRLHTDLGLTTVYVTHDQTEAMSMSDVVVVMREGRIEQIGKPQDIFNRPKSLYVAQFMGYANRLPVTILGKEGDHWLVETDSGARLRATAPWDDAPSWQPKGREFVSQTHTSSQAVLCFRPDETLIDPLPETNHLHGRVQIAEYMGKSFEALVALDGSTGAQILAQSFHPVERDAEVTFGVRPERLLIFPAESSSSPPATGPAPYGAQHSFAITAEAR